MDLNSTNRSPSSYPLENNQNNLDHWDCSLKIADQQEDLLFLAQILQEDLRAEVPSGEFFQVRCAVKNDQLMILTQHPKGVWPDTEKTFVVLEETLQSLSAHQQQRVELFLRVAGQKLPYAKYSLTLSKVADEQRGRGRTKQEVQGEMKKISPLPPLLPRSPAPFLVGSALLLIGSAAYFLTRPCVIFGCPQIQIAKQLQRSFKQMTRNSGFERELPKWQQQFNTASISLKTIPCWSPHFQETEQLSASLSVESEKINQVVKAFQAASLATQKGETAVHSLEELQDRQHLWRQAIAPLEMIAPNSPLYGLVQPKLWVYRTNLQTVKQQLLIEEKWLKKLEIAKAMAQAAVAREASAKSLQDWQHVQSTWLLAVNALSAIPQTSSEYQEAQKLLAEYKSSLLTTRDRATIELLATKTYNQAINAAHLAKSYEQQNQWQAAVAHRSIALNAAKQVSNNTLYYSQAQTLIQPYSTALKQAEEKLQVISSFQKTRTDLDKTCSGAVRLCNFTVDHQGITVWITPEYEQILSRSLISANDQGDPDTVTSVTNHLQTLQQALEAISENAKLYVVFYDTQDRLIYSHIPGG